MSIPTKIDTVKDKAIISIELSGNFYKRIQAVMLHLSEYRDADDLTGLIDKINDEVSPDKYDDWEMAMETLMILCSEIESKAKEQNATETIEINKVDEESTN